ncbi:MAG: SusC/RagA family TonB-linked outer membrane protein, partial [Chitinophagaceae bacterium]
FSSSVGIKTVVDKIGMVDATGFKTLYDEQLKNQAADAGRPYVPYDYTKWQGNTDWQKQIFQNAVLNYNNISIAGATEKNRFYMGLGYITEDGLIKHENLQKLTLNINDEFRVNKALKFGFNFNAYRSKLPQERSVGSAVVAAPIADPFNTQFGLYTSLPDFQRAQVGNPLVDVELRKNTQVNYEYRAVGNISAELDFLKHLNFKATLFADYGFNTGRNYSPLIRVYNPDIVNANPIDTLQRVTSVTQFQNLYTKVQQDYLLTYKNRWDKHSLTLLGGVTSYYSSYEGVNSGRNQGNGINIPNDPRFWYTGIGDASTQIGGGGAYETATLSYLARGIYSYDGKYLFNASFRRDGTSAFPKNGGRYQNFGAVGAAWVLTREDFMSDQSWANELKIKGSYGVLGNQNTGNQYPFFPLLTSANSGVFGNNVVQALAPTYLPDSNLHWETIHAWEGGLELNTLGNKLHFEANYYHKLTKGLLVTIPGIAGTTPGVGNLGEVTNYGIELSASYNNRISKDLTYNISANFTTLHNEVSALSTSGYEIVQDPSRTKQGFPIGYFYGYKAIGVYQTMTEISKSPISTVGTVKPGDLKYADINGDGSITAADRTVIGNPTPDFTYGASFNVSYKGFDVNMDVMGVYGNEIFRNWDRGTFAQFNFPDHRTERWNGVGTSNWEPILSNARSNNYLISSYYIEDGSFFRVRNAQIGYNFDPAILSRIHLKALRVYVNAQNLKTYKNSTGYTPEFGGSATSFGIDNGSYPLPAIYTFGFNLNF